MIPTYKQYKSWSLPSKYGFWGVVLSIIPMLIALKNWVEAVPDYASLAFNYGGSQMTIYGAAGESPETAVIIRGANSHEAGVVAEYYWIARRYPGYKRVQQALIEQPELGSQHRRSILVDKRTGAKVEMVEASPLPPRMFDVLKIRNWYFREKDIYFDITPFYNTSSEPRPGGISEDEAMRRTDELMRAEIDRIEKAKLGGDSAPQSNNSLQARRP